MMNLDPQHRTKVAPKVRNIAVFKGEVRKGAPGIRKLTLLLTIASLILISSTLSAQISTATTYYVAKNGNNNNPGTETQPFLTINKGARVLSPGDTLLVKNGVYLEALEDRIPSGTSWDAPVTVKAYPGHRPTLKPNVGPNFVLGFHAGTNGNDTYIVVDGFILDAVNVGFQAVKMQGDVGKVHHIRLANMEIKNAKHSGILAAGGGSYEFINLDIHDNGSSISDHGIYLTSPNNLIEGCDIYDNASRAVQMASPGPTGMARQTVRNNKFHDNGRAGVSALMYLNQAHDSGVYNNLFYNQVGEGMVVLRTNDSKIYNNTFYNLTGGKGSIVGEGGLVLIRSHRNIVQNNIIHTTFGVYGYSVFIYDNTSENHILNNITWRWNNSPIRNNGTNNRVAGNQSADPLLVDPENGDFHLREGSPAIDAGLTLTGFVNDFEGNPRPQGSTYDIGAYERPTAGLSRPTNLVVGSP